jgi:hypothetical protein
MAVVHHAGPTGEGHIQLRWTDDAGSLPGHSGSPVVDATTGALVGLLRAGSVTARFDRYVPLPLLRRAGVPVRAPWLMRKDSQDHFDRRARGQRAVDAGGGDLFQGRVQALARIRDWLTTPEPPGSVLVVTGQPGAGKSAVVARAGLEQAGQATRRPPGPGGFGGADGMLFHARAATAVDLRTELADLTGANDDSSTTGLMESLDRLHADLPHHPTTAGFPGLEVT